MISNLISSAPDRWTLKPIGVFITLWKPIKTTDVYRIKTSDNHVNYFGVLRSWNLGLRAMHVITYKSIESYNSILWFVINIYYCFCNSQESVLSVCVFVCLFV